MVIAQALELLQLSQGANRKDVRRAYAAQIKMCRPDEKPEDFQQLRRAYELLLAHSDEDSLNVNPVPTEPNACGESVVDADAELTCYVTPLSPDIEEEFLDLIDPSEADDFLQQRVAQIHTAHEPKSPESTADDTNIDIWQVADDFLEQTRALLDCSIDRKQMSRWQALLNHDVCFDLEVRDHVSRNLFFQVVEAQVEAQQTRGSANILTHDVLAPLIAFWGWDKDVHLQRQYSAAEYFSVVPRPPGEDNVSGRLLPKLKKASYFGRLLAFAIDLFFVMLLIGGVFVIYIESGAEAWLDAMTRHEEEWEFLLSVGLYFGYFAVLECRSSRRTLGMKFLSYRIVSLFGTKPSLSLIGYRQFWRFLSTVLIALLASIDKLPGLVFLLILILVVLLYDRMSDTMTIKHKA